jgi:hypothetical protein
MPSYESRGNAFYAYSNAEPKHRQAQQQMLLQIQIPHVHTVSERSVCIVKWEVDRSHDVRAVETTTDRSSVLE